MAQHTITFDTFQYAQDLQKAGFTEIQVETQVKHVKKQTDAINNFIDDSLATKQDIKELESKIDTKIDANKNELNLKIDANKNELNLKIDAIKNELLLKLGRMIIGSTVGGLSTLVVLMKLFKL